MALRSLADSFDEFWPRPNEARDSSLMMACAARYRGSSAGACFSPRPWQKLPTAIGAAPVHALGTRSTEGAFVAANPRLIAILRQRRFAALAFRPHFEGHTCSFRRQTCSLDQYFAGTSPCHPSANA